MLASHGFDLEVGQIEELETVTKLEPWRKSIVEVNSVTYLVEFDEKLERAESDVGFDSKFHMN